MKSVFFGAILLLIGCGPDNERNLDVEGCAVTGTQLRCPDGQEIDLPPQEAVDATPEQPTTDQPNLGVGEPNTGERPIYQCDIVIPRHMGFGRLTRKVHKNHDGFVDKEQRITKRKKIRRRVMKPKHVGVPGDVKSIVFSDRWQGPEGKELMTDLAFSTKNYANVKRFREAVAEQLYLLYEPVITKALPKLHKLEYDETSNRFKNGVKSHHIRDYYIEGMQEAVQYTDGDGVKTGGNDVGSKRLIEVRNCQEVF